MRIQLYLQHLPSYAYLNPQTDILATIEMIEFAPIGVWSLCCKEREAIKIKGKLWIFILIDDSQRHIFLSTELSRAIRLVQYIFGLFVPIKIRAVDTVLTYSRGRSQNFSPQKFPGNDAVTISSTSLYGRYCSLQPAEWQTAGYKVLRLVYFRKRSHSQRLYWVHHRSPTEFQIHC